MDGLEFGGGMRASLRDLSLAHCRNATDDSVSALLSRFPALTSLDLSFCGSLGDAALDALPPSVRALNVLGNPRMSFDRLQAIGESLGSGQLKSDDTAVMGTGGQGAQSLMEMLEWYKQEENRWC